MYEPTFDKSNSKKREDGITGNQDQQVQLRHVFNNQNVAHLQQNVNLTRNAAFARQHVTTAPTVPATSAFLPNTMKVKSFNRMNSAAGFGKTEQANQLKGQGVQLKNI